MIRAMAGRTRLLVSETIRPQIASATITAMTTRPIHLLESAGDDSGADVLGFSSMAIAYLS